jgi:antitoxin CptB
MNVNIEILKKKIIYRSQYRGTKEMDKLLSSFVLKHIDNLNLSQLSNLEKFLDIDDDNLYKFYNGYKTDYQFVENEIHTLFKDFKYDQK